MGHRSLRKGVLPGIALMLCACFASAREDDWRQVTPEELSMVKEPLAPGAPAIYLYTQTDRTDSTNIEKVYRQIKILTDAGRVYGNLEIQYDKYAEAIRGIEARVIQPDGSVTPFKGQIFEKPIVTSSERKRLAKTFALPDVRVGSIVEYRFERDQQNDSLYDSRWLLSSELFTRYASFSLRPYLYSTLRWDWPRGLPEGTAPPVMIKDVIRLETRNVPAFVSEPYMPPEEDMKFSVIFYYTNEQDPKSGPDVFWNSVAKRMHKVIDQYVSQRAALKEAVGRIVDPADSPETRVGKIYARVQSLRNTSYERQQDDQEARRSTDRTIHNAAEVWKYGYGSSTDLRWLFLGLVRAAGIESDAVFLAPRNRTFFSKKILNPAVLQDCVISVKLADKFIYLDPGRPFMPYGLLAWQDSGVQAMRVNAEGATWVSTPLPDPTASVTHHEATLRLTEAGALEGHVVITHTGLNAYWRRLQQQHEDEKGRKDFLEKDLNGDIPGNAVVSLTKTPDWANAETPMVVEYDVRMADWVVDAGGRMLLPVGLFGQPEHGVFPHATRVQPMHFSYPNRQDDEVTITLPARWTVQSVPAARKQDIKVLSYSIAARNTDTPLTIERHYLLGLVFAEARTYNAVRNFFQGVEAGDQDQIIIARP
jgi:Domain of Unknown Function with PDB structure (DUF3857)